MNYLSFNYIAATNTYLNTKRIAITVTTMSFLENLPVKSLIITYEIAPIAIPFEIEYVRGISVNVKKAG